MSTINSDATLGKIIFTRRSEQKMKQWGFNLPPRRFF